MPQLALAPTRLAGSVLNQELPYVLSWRTTPPAPTIALTTAPIASIGASPFQHSDSWWPQKPCANSEWTGADGNRGW